MPNDPDLESNRKKALKGRNVALALLLVGMVLLFYFITISRITASVGS